MYYPHTPTLPTLFTIKGKAIETRGSEGGRGINESVAITSDYNINRTKKRPINRTENNKTW